MKGKNFILIGSGITIAAMSLKAAFDFGAKMGISVILSELPEEDLSQILSIEKGRWYKDISKIITERRK